MVSNHPAQIETKRRTSLVEKFSSKFGVDADKMMTTLKATAFKQRDGSAPSNEQMMALMVVADQYGLNPFTREIYAFPDKQNGIVPVVGVDGWSRIINTHPQFDGMDFKYSETNIDNLKGQTHPAPEWCECIMYRKDRTRPIIVREYLDEVYRPPFKEGMIGPWQSHTRRFHRHKTMIQTARLAFGFVGIFDEDEAERIVERDMGDAERVVETAQTKSSSTLPEYTDEEFEARFTAWADLIASGKKTPEQAIAFLSSKATLSDKQKDMIRNVEVIDGNA